MMNELIILWFERTDGLVTDITNKMDISCGSAYSITHQDLRYLTICARWVPKQLTDKHKQAHMKM
jgi:hypothetical protein